MAIGAQSGRPPAGLKTPILDVPLWCAIVLGLVMLWVWGSAVSVRFYGATTLMVVVFLLLFNAGYRRLRPNPANPIPIMVETAASFIAFAGVGAPITYLVARNDHALVDRSLTRIDHWFGFDWTAWNQFVVAHHALNLVLHIVYFSLDGQAILAFAFLPLVKGGMRGYTLVRQGVVGIVITGILCWVYPALGTARADWTDTVLALRGSAPLAFSCDTLKGVISFPSFHAVLGILFIHAFRGTALAIPITLLNIGLIVAALNVGNHYLTDVLAGAVVAVAAIGSGAWIDRVMPVTKPNTT